MSRRGSAKTRNRWCGTSWNTPPPPGSPRSPMHHLFVTNDFPPKHGGIQTMLWELWRRLDPSSFTVFTTPYDGAAEWDADQPFRVEIGRASCRERVCQSV